MFLAAILAMFTVIMNDNIPEITIANRIIAKFVRVNVDINWEIAAAAPVLVLFIEYSAINDSPITIVLIAPNKNKNSLWSFIFRKDLPISAACDAPSPGKNAVNGAANMDASEAFCMDFFDSLILLNGKIFCSGTLVFCPILIIKLLAPNSPVSNGSNGSFTLIFSAAIPKNPAIRNMNSAQSLLFFSELIRNNETAIKITGIIF